VSLEGILPKSVAHSTIEFMAVGHTGRPPTTHALGT